MSEKPIDSVLDAEVLGKSTLVGDYNLPFLKWAGGKRQLLDRILPRVPGSIETYYEPFIGSGAVFLALKKSGRIRAARLSDTNEELINAYVQVRDSLPGLVKRLAAHARQHSKEHYYAVRSLEVGSISELERAARLIYLNKTCFNGLYRVNRKGQFNVPMGAYKKPAILNEPRLKEASTLLQDAEIVVSDFEDAVGDAVSGDFIYFDPPYVPLSSTSNYTSYTMGQFDQAQQERLAALCDRLSEKGVSWLLSNSDTPLARKLWGHHEMATVTATRAINSKAEGRGLVSEILAESRGRIDG
jgi:DNA adenine methylase